MLFGRVSGGGEHLYLGVYIIIKIIASVEAWKVTLSSPTSTPGANLSPKLGMSAEFCLETTEFFQFGKVNNLL